MGGGVPIEAATHIHSIEAIWHGWGVLIEAGTNIDPIEALWHG